MLDYMKFWFAKAAAEFITGIIVLVVMFAIFFICFFVSECRSRKRREREK